MIDLKFLGVDCNVIIIFLIFAELHTKVAGRKLVPPIVINTWNFTNANSRAWRELESGHSALDAIELGCGQCEIDRCDGTVGWGGSPAETGETTLDALIMDGENYNVGAVGALRRVKGAIYVARLVLERTNHSLLVGEMATKFAVQMGVREESLTSKESAKIQADWANNSCQPNYWTNVSPDPRRHCGPYKLVPLTNKLTSVRQRVDDRLQESTKNIYTNHLAGHDTIGMIALDKGGRIAAGTSTNGLGHKILGRVGDSPIPGAGAYADHEVGAAAATGDGDIMMRFLLSFKVIENMRHGMSAYQAAREAVRHMIQRLIKTELEMAAVVVLGKDGTFGAACAGSKLPKFAYVVSDAREQHRTYVTPCMGW